MKIDEKTVNPTKICVRSYHREKNLRTRNCHRRFIKHFLKNTKKTCEPSNRDLNRDWMNFKLSHN